MRQMIGGIVALLAWPLLLNAQAAAAQTSAEYDRVVQGAVDSGRFSGVVLIREGDTTLYERATGDAVREFGVPITMETRFKFHSLTKPIASVAFHALVARDILDPSASVCTYLEGCPEGWQAVRVEHLLDHSSGIPELENDWYSGWEGTLASTYRESIATREELAPVSAPGASMSYSNGGYTLLSYIMEVASGRTIEQLLDQLVFQPAGMSDAGLEQTPDLSVSGWYRGGVVVDRLANGYNGSPDEVRTAYSLMYTVPGAGGVYGTAEDLARFARAVFEDALLPEDVVERMVTPTGPSDRYARGWVVGEREGRRSFGHDGGSNGFLASLEYFPDSGTSIIILSNLGFADLRGLRAGLAEVRFSDDREF